MALTRILPAGYNAQTLKRSNALTLTRSFIEVKILTNILNQHFQTTDAICSASEFFRRCINQFPRVCSPRTGSREPRMVANSTCTPIRRKSFSQWCNVDQSYQPAKSPFKLPQLLASHHRWNLAAALVLPVARYLRTNPCSKSHPCQFWNQRLRDACASLCLSFSQVQCTTL